MHAMDGMFHSRESILHTLEVMAYNCMKQQAYQHHSKNSFEVGDQVFLRLHPYKHIYIKAKDHKNLALKIYGT